MTKKYTILERSESKYTKNNSQFIGIIESIDSVDDVKQRLKKTKELFPESHHICYAYRYINDSNVLYEYSTDNNEPQGTAGKPILHVLQSEDIYNNMLLVVRYFGGKLLGIRGLIDAYSTTAQQTIQKSNKSPFVRYEYREINCSIGDFENTQMSIKSQGGIILKTEFGLIVSIEYKIPQNL